MRTSIATVCLSGTLSEKLHAAGAAGFDGVVPRWWHVRHRRGP